MRNFKVFIVLFVILTLTACNQKAINVPAICDVAPGCAVFNLGEPIKIATAGPMSGEYSQYGIDMANAMSIAASDAGTLNGSSFEIIPFDDLGTPEGAAAVANKIVTDPTILAIAGHSSSGATAAAIPIYEAASIPMMSPSATNPDLTKNGSTVFNRNAFTDAFQAFGSAIFMREDLDAKDIAILHDGSDYGQALADNVKNEFVSLGGEVVLFDAITPGEFDYTPPLLVIQNLAPTAIYYAGYMAEAAVIVNQMNQLNMTEISFVSGDGVFGSDYIDKTGTNGIGSYASTLIPPNSANVSKFNSAYKDRFGIEPGSLSAFSWNSYDAALALINAIQRVAIIEGDKIYVPRAELVNAVRTTKDLNGLTGVINCSEFGECNQTGPVFYRSDGVSWQPVE